MKNRIFLLLLSIFIFSPLLGQPPETIYLGNIIHQGDDDDTGYGPYNIGFNFTFFGNVYSEFYVNSNGLLTFGASTDAYEPVTIPTASAPNNYIAPFWDDLAMGSEGKMLYTTIGTSPNRKCIVQWTNMRFPSDLLLGTFLVILYEGSNSIQLQYRSIISSHSMAHGAFATIGLENSDGSAGVLYSYQTASVNSEQAIRFTPSGLTYTVNNSAFYDGIYLTTNMSLPEPGIPDLIVPASNSTIGNAERFDWSEASNAGSYTLKISKNADLSGSANYNTGTNTYWDVSGLTVDATYYWAVFATNATGTTWSEIKRFYTSATPPSTPVPQTVWMEFSEERMIDLQYTGGDASAKTAVITTLPVSGELYQYNAGVKGGQITSVPTNVTDSEMRVIYVANGSTGNNAGNFNFLVHDDNGDSSPALITVNVNSAGVPNLLLAAKSSNVEIQFDRPMADPSGKEAQFSVSVDGFSATISSVALKEGDPYTISVTLNAPLTGTETVLISYTQGTVAASAGGLLPSFADQPVNLLLQTILFDALPATTYGDSPITLSATASSGLTVTFTSSNSSVASILGNTLTVNSAGSSQITARQIGDDTYAPVRYIRTLTVGKATQTITMPDLPAAKYGDNDIDPGATASSGLTVTYSSDNPNVAAIVDGKIRITGAGTASITASQGGNQNYEAAPNVSKTLTVGKAAQTITMPDLPEAKYGDDDIDPGATATSGLTVTYSSDNTDVAAIVDGKIRVTGAGTASITASQGGNQNYEAAPNVSKTLTVGKAAQTITMSDLSAAKYGDDDIDPGATATSGLTVTYSSNNTDVATIVDGKIRITGAGTASITASQGGNQNYEAAPNVSKTLTVGKATQTITMPELPAAKYGDADIDPEATASSGLTVTYSSDNTDVAAIVDGKIRVTGAGTASITASQEGNQNYEAAPNVGKTLTVGKATQTITMPDLPTAKYGDADIDPGATASSGLTVTYSSDNTDVATIVDGKIRITGAGTASITASQEGNQNYEAAPDVSETLTVNKADLTFKADDKEREYLESNPVLTYTVTGFVMDEDETVLNELPAIAVDATIDSPAGSYTISVSGGSDNNYNYLYLPGTLTITKLNQTITMPDLPAAKYGDADIDPGATASSGLTVTYASSDTTVAVIVDGKIRITGAGTASITASQGGNQNYEAAPNVSKTLTVGKATQTITMPDLPEAKYGDDDIDPGATASSGLTVTYSSDNTDVAAIVDGKIRVTGTGTASITASQGGNQNYEAAPNVSKTLTVNKADLTFKADDKEREYLESNPVLTYTVTGFVMGEDETVLNELPAIAVDATIDSPAGSYTISVSGGSDNNYNYLYIPGTLTINKISQTITVTNSPGELLINNSYDIVAISSSGLPVSFESLHPDIAEISGSAVRGILGGTATIRAYSDGDINYFPAETTFDIIIKPTHRDVMNLFTPNNDGYNDYWEIIDLDQLGRCEVLIYNRVGQLVFRSTDYHNEWDGTSGGSPLPPAPYYYIIKTENSGTLTGTVNLVR